MATYLVQAMHFGGAHKNKTAFNNDKFRRHSITLSGDKTTDRRRRGSATLNEPEGGIILTRNKRRRRRGSRHVTFGDGKAPERETHFDWTSLRKQMEDLAMDETRFGDTESGEEWVNTPFGDKEGVGEVEGDEVKMNHKTYKVLKGLVSSVCMHGGYREYPDIHTKDFKLFRGIRVARKGCLGERWTMVDRRAAFHIRVHFEAKRKLV